MQIETEPEAGSLRAVLDQLLEPHGLEARSNPTGWLVVVRSPEADSPKERTSSGEPPPAPESRPAQRVLVSDSIEVTPAAQLAVNVVHAGRPVRGLGIGDFELLAGRKPLEILGLEVVDLASLGRSPPVAVPDLPSGGRRHFLLAFDTEAEVAGSISRAGEAAARFLREGFHFADLVGVATLSRDQAPRLVLGFTSDRRAAAATVDVVTGRQDTALVTDPLGLLVKPIHTRVTSRFQTQVPASQIVLPTDSRSHFPTEDGRTDGVLDLESAVERAERQQALGRLLVLSESMTRLAHMLRATPGRKQIVLFTEGFGGEILDGLSGGSMDERNRIEEMNRAVAQGEYWKVSTDERYGSVAALSSFDRMLDEFARSGTVIHPVDTRLVAGDGARGPRSQGALHQLASRTGGAYVLASGNLSGQLVSLLGSSEVTYLLRFAPPLSDEGDRRPRLRVRLRRGLPGRVHYPATYAEAGSAAGTTLERRLRGADLITGGQDGGDFHTEVTVGEAESGPDYSSVEISVSAAICSLPGACDPARQAEVYVYALSDDGSIGDYFARGVRVEDDPAPGRPRSRGFRVRDVLELAFGSYSVRTLVVDRRSGASSLATARLRLERPDT